jgi:hypothetical protein
MGQMANGGNTSWMVAAAFIQLSHFKPGWPDDFVENKRPKWSPNNSCPN